MADTNFGALLTHQKTSWARDVWHEVRDTSFVMKFMGKGSNNMIERVTELTKTSKGTKAVMTLVNDPVGDGIVGDNELEGNEEALSARDLEINIDQLRHAHRSKGRMAEQATIVKFRKEAKGSLAHWMADRIDQQAFLVLAGMPLTLNNDGSTRAGDPWSALAWAGDIAAPTSNRHYNWTATGLEAGNTAATNHAKMSYDMIIEIRAKARRSKLKPVRGKDGTALYHVFISPEAMKDLKKDPEFRENLRHANIRSEKNKLFAGSESFLLDGMVIHDYYHVPTATNWGAGSATGSTALVCGAQALGMCDLGPGYWDEEEFDYKNKPGIAYGKIYGFRKPKFHSTTTGQVEDFSVMRVDVAI